MSAGSAQASFRHTVKNVSKETIVFSVRYPACKGDSVTLKPGASTTIKSYMCCIVSATAKLGNATATTPADPKSSAACASTSWTVDGQKDGAGLAVKRI